MPVARCNDCSAEIAWYAHAGRKLRELRCPCGGELTNAPWTSCRGCGRMGYHRREPDERRKLRPARYELPGHRKLCNKCFDGEEKRYPRFRVSTTRPAMGATKIRTVCKGEWKREQGESSPEYRHISGEWVVRKVDLSGYKTPRFRGIYIGPRRAQNPSLPPTDSLHESQLNVANWILEDREDMSPRNRAIRAQQAGNASLVLDCIFDHIDQKFDELQREFDDRLSRLTITM